jgi:type II secretory ATPase GspE/PulE/Tfp pilus assembly ATPase PilB-like protein
MIGEIRDAETADIAINAALTGHLLLSTLHTNDAPTAIPRLGDLKIQPFLIASTLNIVIAQRLVRRLCRVCIVSNELDVQTQKMLKVQAEKFGLEIESLPKITYASKGCAVCNFNCLHLYYSDVIRR